MTNHMTNEKQTRVLVIGLGRFGTSLAESLTDAGHEVVAVDIDMDRVSAIKDRVTLAAQLDATDPAALRSVDAASATIAVVAMGASFEAAALSVVAVKELGVAKILARARSLARGKILAAVGATRIIELEAEMAKQVSRTLTE